jgi:hypothetical protein
MLSGDFGQQIMKDTSILKWKMNLLYLRRKSDRDLKAEIFQKHSQCPDWELLSTPSCIKNTI